MDRELIQRAMRQVGADRMGELAGLMGYTCGDWALTWDVPPPAATLLWLIAEGHVSREALEQCRAALRLEVAA